MNKLDTKANVQELHHIVFQNDPKINDYDLKSQLKHSKKINPSYEIQEHELEYGSLFNNSLEPIFADEELSNSFILKFVGYKLNHKVISNPAYTCNLYWTASNCLLFSYQKAKELPIFHICHNLQSLLEVLTHCAIDPKFLEKDIAGTILNRALHVSEWCFDKEGFYDLYTPDTYDISKFLHYAVEQKSLNYYPYLYKIKGKDNPSYPDEAGIAFFVAKHLGADVIDINYAPMSPVLIETDQGLVRSNSKRRELFITPSMELISVLTHYYQEEVIDESTGIKFDKFYSGYASIESAPYIDDLWMNHPEFNLGSGAVRTALMHLKHAQPTIYQDYVITNDDERDTQFNGCLVDVAIRIPEPSLVECMRLFKTSGDTLICHKIIYNMPEKTFLQQQSLVTDNHEQIVIFFGLSAEAKLLYKNLGINTNQTVK